MTAHTFEIDVDASPGRAFEVFTDLANNATVVRGIEKMEILTDGPIGVGTRFRETRVMMGKQATEGMELTPLRTRRAVCP
jgi:hypothetical protein